MRTASRFLLEHQPVPAIYTPEYRRAEALVADRQEKRLMRRFGEEALRRMQHNIDQSNEDRPFHTTQHSQDVKIFAFEFLGAISGIDLEIVSVDEVLAASMAAHAHDVYIATIADEVLAGFGDPEKERQNQAKLGKRQRVRGFDETDNRLLSRAVAAAQQIPNSKKRVGGNEAHSAHEAREILEKIDTKATLRQRYSSLEEKIGAAIGVTYPEVAPKALAERFPMATGFASITDDAVSFRGRDLTAYLTRRINGKIAELVFDQSHLTPESSLAVVAVAVGDLSHQGRIDKAALLERGNAEFREVNAEIALRLAQGLDTLSPLKKAAIAKEALDFTTGQVAFVLTQALRFEEILETNRTINQSAKSAEIKAALRRLWSNFGENLEKAIEVAQQQEARFGMLREPSTFASDSKKADRKLAQLLRFMGYQIRPRTRPEGFHSGIHSEPCQAFAI